MLIGEKKVVRIDYTLKNASGEVLDTSEGGEPLSYLHGGHQIVPGLEKELSGMQAGDSKDVVVAPEDGYGQPDPQGIFGVPRNAFPPEAQLTVGNSRQVLVHERNETIEGAWHAVSQLTERLGDRVLCDRSHVSPSGSRRPSRGQRYASLGAWTIMSRDAREAARA